MATLGTVSNKILVKGDPVIVEYKTVPADITPGDLVKLNTSDVEIEEGGAATGTKDLGIGIVSYEHTGAHYKDGHTITTAFAADDFVAVIMCGSGCIVMANVEANLYRGSALTSQTSDGHLTTGTIGTNHIYAILLEDDPSIGLAKVLLL